MLIWCLLFFQISFHVEINEEISDYREITVEVKGPSGKVDCRLNLNSSASGKGTFTASEIGIHEVVVKYQGEPVVGSPLKCRVLPQYSEISYSGRLVALNRWVTALLFCWFNVIRQKCTHVKKQAGFREWICPFYLPFPSSIFCQLIIALSLGMHFFNSLEDLKQNKINSK